MANRDATSPNGTQDEAIGRPGPWGENRYEKKGQPVDQSVRSPPGNSPSEDKPVSTPVTRRDYATPGSGKDSAANNDNASPGGDAG